jgi:heme exporter protein CcmD
MNGYEIYVYGAYGFAALLIGGLCLHTYLAARKNKQ